MEAPEDRKFPETGSPAIWETQVCYLQMGIEKEMGLQLDLAAELEGDEYTAEMAVMTALKAIPPRGELDAEDLAKSFAGTGKIAGAQQAVMISPWTGYGWDALGEAVAWRG